MLYHFAISLAKGIILQAKQAELAAKQPELDALTARLHLIELGDKVMMSDLRSLDSNMKNLKVLIFENLERSESSLQEHESFSNEELSISKWLVDLEKQVAKCKQHATSSSDTVSLDEQESRLNEVVYERDSKAEKLQNVLKDGEHLYASTSQEGRELIRQQLRNITDQWENINTTLTDVQRRLDGARVQVTSYDESATLSSNWLQETETTIRKILEEKYANLDEKKESLSNYRSRYADIVARQHVFDSLAEKAESIAGPQSKAVKQVQGLKKQYENLLQLNDKAMNDLTNILSAHETYEEKQRAANEWLKNCFDKIGACKDVAGDKFAIQHKLEKIKEIDDRKHEGSTLVQATITASKAVLDTTTISGQDVIRKEVLDMKNNWEELCATIDLTIDNLQRALSNWQVYNETYQILIDWLRSCENQIKTQQLGATLEEKKEQLEIYKNINQDLLSRQSEMDQIIASGENLKGVSGDNRVLQSTSVLRNKYESLCEDVGDICEKFDKVVSEHSIYREKYCNLTEWLKNSKNRLDKTKSHCETDNVKSKSQSLDSLLKESEITGQNLLQTALSAGELIYSDTSHEGRNKIRQQLRTAQEAWEAFRSELISSQRSLTNIQQELNELKELQRQLEKWFDEVRVQLEEFRIGSTLPEKKQISDEYKIILHDVESHGKSLMKIMEKGRSSAIATYNNEILNFVKSAKERYENVLLLSRSSLEQSEKSVDDHVKFDEAKQNVEDWLKLSFDTLEGCEHFSTDRLSISGKLEKVNNLINSKNEGEALVRDFKNLLHSVQNSTHSSGKAMFKDQVASVENSWSQFQQNLEHALKKLKEHKEDWDKFSTMNEQVEKELREIERNIRDISACNSLEEKLKSKNTVLVTRNCFSASYIFLTQYFLGSPKPNKATSAIN